MEFTSTSVVHNILRAVGTSVVFLLRPAMVFVSALFGVIRVKLNRK